MSKTYLKIKIVSLMAEAKLIRKEENKFKQRRRDACEYIKTLDSDHNSSALSQYKDITDTFWGLKDHRKNAVGSESRVACIAYGYLRGRPYRVVENPPTWMGRYLYKGPDMNRVYALVHKYGDNPNFDEVKIAVDAWMKEPMPKKHSEKIAKAVAKAEKAKSRKVYTVDVSSLPPEKVQEVFNKVKEKHRTKAA
jgi:hypothetical protein